MEIKEVKKEKVKREAQPIYFKRWWIAFKNIDWKNPINKWKAIFLGTIALVIIGGFAATALVVSDTTWFCVTMCHEMAPEEMTTAASAHKEVRCVDCHVQPGPYYEALLHKMHSLKEVYYHFTGVPNPLHQTESQAIPNETCLRCHSLNRIVTESGDLKSYHSGHVEAGVYCINCHSGVAHGKIAERGLNTHDTYDKWVEGVSEILVTDYERKTNMGTCIECHAFVNEGKTPYNDINYALPQMTKPKDHTKEAKMIYENVDPATGEKMTQKLILQSLGKGGKDQKISMACATCHKTINTPQDHQAKNWAYNHGGSAMKNVQACTDCHKDSLWERRLPWVEFDEELNKSKEAEKVTTPAVMKETARENTFCNSCHGDRPESHQSTGWLTKHATASKTDTQKAGCYVCHDNEKPTGNQVTKAPTDVYCAYCHRQGFKK